MTFHPIEVGLYLRISERFEVMIQKNNSSNCS